MKDQTLWRTAFLHSSINSIDFESPECEADEGSNYFLSHLFRATIVQHTAGSGIKSGKVQTESVAKPAIVRAADGEFF